MAVPPQSTTFIIIPVSADDAFPLILSAFLSPYISSSKTTAAPVTDFTFPNTLIAVPVYVETLFTYIAEPLP